MAIYKVLRYPLSPVLDKRMKQKRAKTKIAIFQDLAIEDRFTKIYKSNYWGNRGSISGDGSTLEYTKCLRTNLPKMFDEFSIRRVFDAPCGDFNWMKLVVKDCDIQYLGADIVNILIVNNNDNYGNSSVRFIHFDITRDDFPESDLWICRDCLFHLSFEDTFRAFRRYIDSNIPYVLTTTHKNINDFENIDINTGDFRLIDLFERPYFLPRDVLFRIDDYLSPEPPREMCLWTREQIIESMKTSVDLDLQNG